MEAARCVRIDEQDLRRTLLLATVVLALLIVADTASAGCFWFYGTEISGCF